MSAQTYRRRKRTPHWGRIIAALLVLALLIIGLLWLLFNWDEGGISSPDGPTVVVGNGTGGTPAADGSTPAQDTPAQSGPANTDADADPYSQPELTALAGRLDQTLAQARQAAAAGGWLQDDDTAAMLANADALCGIWQAGTAQADWAQNAQAALDQLQAALPALAQPRPHTVETVDGVTYVDGVLVVNKTYPIPADYGDGLTPEAQAAFDAMQAGAAADGISLKIISGYRSYERQNQIYNNYVARDGRAAADTYSARPGHSEHQTGLAMDINSLEQSMGQDPDGIWLAAHCAEYGFILRYPQGKEDITGYMYEPWHVRYLGAELAAAITDSGLTLEEYFGLTSEYAEG